MSRVELHYLPITEHGFDINLEQAVACLDEFETERYHRYKSEHAQKCFLQARRIAKVELAKKLGCTPADVVFDYTETEKPFLKPFLCAQSGQWHFNISHSQTAIVVGISQSPVGVDVEDISRCEKVWRNAENFLNAYVKSCVDRGRSDSESAAIFAEHWTCTESYIKLKGSAIYREKDRVVARPHSNFMAGSYKTFEDSCFTIFNFSDEVRIAIAVEHNFPEITLLHWRTGENRCYSPEAMRSSLS